MTGVAPILPHTLPVAASAGEGAWARGVLERQLWMLDRVAEAGLDIVLALRRQALAQAGEAASGAPDLGDLVVEATTADEDESEAAVAPSVAQGIVLAYARASRAVRLTLAQQAKVVQDIQVLDRSASLEAATKGAREAARQASAVALDRMRAAAMTPQDVRRDRVGRIVERVIAGEHDDERLIERLTTEARERLEDDDIYGDLLARPMSEIVADICRDLGLSPDWIRLAQEAWAQEEIDSGAPGSPLATTMAQGAQTPPPTAAPDPFRFAPHAASP